MNAQSTIPSIASDVPRLVDAVLKNVEAWLAQKPLKAKQPIKNALAAAVDLP